ncbi:Hypothetical predicted protein [Xyrichtys novacula]|uniref:Uncharacterized protein n=1 Tax=Xyrichtys novacula TaxID=13765 RepID=A0AAV1GA46_XYRNO|nr:Hypothetical predicted protein [Xyrichtys novacula]
MSHLETHPERREGDRCVFTGRPPKLDLRWRAARVETLDLIQHDEVLRLPSHTGLQRWAVFDRDGGTKTIMSSDVCRRRSPGSLTLIGRDGGRRARAAERAPEKTEKRLRK